MYIPEFIWGILVGIMLTFIAAYLFVRYEDNKKGKHENSDSKKNIHGKLDESDKDSTL